jgi:osmoprotectant transport system ATP-binding protein
MTVALDMSLVQVSLAGRPVLRDITLTLASGQTHVVLGLSGCGKSTLLRAITGLVPLHSGSIQVLGRQVCAPEQSNINSALGYVIQDGGLFPHLTVEANMQLPAVLRRHTRATMNQRTRQLMTLLQLDAALLERFPSQLSGGQRQRVALARALMLDPQLLLLDEPLAALDPLTRSDLQQELRVLFQSLGKTVVWVTHDLAEAAFLGHTVTLLHQGVVEQHGSFSALVGAPATPFVQRFVGSQRLLHALEVPT